VALEYVEGTITQADVDLWAVTVLSEGFTPGAQFLQNFALAGLAVALEPAATEGDVYALTFINGLAGMDLAETAGAQAIAKVCLKAIERALSED